jgi:peroxiredoxin
MKSFHRLNILPGAMLKGDNIMLLALFLSLTLATEDDPFLLSGDEAPEFELPLFQSDSTITLKDAVKLADYTFLIFWTTNCPTCLATLANIKEIQTEFDTLKWDVNVLSINYDREDWDFVKGFIQKEKISFPVLVDEEGDVAYEYGADMYNISFFLINKKGIIAWSYPDHPEEPKNAKEELILSIKEAVFSEEKE